MNDNNDNNGKGTTKPCARPPCCAQGPACSMAHAGLQHCLPCPSKATALLYCNCHLALPCPHCTATPVSLRLTALPGMHTPAAPRMHCVLRVPHFFALPVPAVPYGFIRNRPFTVRMSCMLCAASACRRRGACGASVHRRRLCACANCNHPACTAEHCTLPPRVTQALPIPCTALLLA